MAKAKISYDEKSIKTIDALEHIRLRTGMYIGRLGDGSNPMDGIYILLKEVLDCVSKVNTGGKFDDDVFQFSVGLNGIGTNAVNALSAGFEVVSRAQRVAADRVARRSPVRVRPGAELDRHWLGFTDACF